MDEESKSGNVLSPTQLLMMADADGSSVSSDGGHSRSTLKSQKHVDVFQDIHVDTGVLLPSQLKKDVQDGSLSISSTATSQQKEESAENEGEGEGEIPGSDVATAGEMHDDQAPERKQQKFEFTEGFCVFRLIRTVLYIQVIAVIIDNPTIVLPVAFKVFCRTICYYSLHFYSRPFMDIIYILQKFGGDIITYFHMLQSSSKQNRAELHITDGLGFSNSIDENRRELLASTGEDIASSNNLINFLDLKTWHFTVYMGHFFLSIMFTVLAVLFLLKFWEIKDFTDRNILRTWIREYVSDGWWRRGLLHVAIITGKACFATFTLGCALYILARQFSSISFPSGTMVAGTFVLSTVIMFVVTLFGLTLIRSAESAFVRYVSQNVGYTSTMILKRVIKAKTEVGLFLMICMYLPALYVFTKSVIIAVDWNDSHALPFRIKENQNVPCYFLAFPPFIDRVTAVSGYECPLKEKMSPLLPNRRMGFYDTGNIMQCDTFLGMFFFLLGVILIVMTVVSYNYILYRLIFQVIHEYKNSRWVRPLYNVNNIYNDELREYNSMYPFSHRLLLRIRSELSKQYKYIIDSGIFIVLAIIGVTQCFLSIFLCPVAFLCAVPMFFLKRIFILMCNDYTKEGRQRKLLQSLREKQKKTEKRSKAGLIFDDDEKHAQEHDVEKAELSHVKSNLQIFREQIGSIDFYKTCGSRLKDWCNRSYHDCRRGVLYYLAEARVCWYHSKQFLLCSAKKTISFHNLPGARLSDWRNEFLVSTKERRLRDLKANIVLEVTKSKYEFVADHDLAIGVFDYVVDTGGTFLLICPYDYDRMQWTLVIMLELTVYGLMSPYLNITTDWQTRGGLICAVTIVFGVLTYILGPYTEEADRWFEFLGRVMIVGSFFGIYIADSVAPGDYKPFHVNMFSPWVALPDLIELSQSGLALYILIDFVIVVYFYFYVVNILANIGFFGMVERKLQSLKFGMHDNILNYLVYKADERTFGSENVFTGLQFIQQWDDILKQQRRYALLPWADVRPPWLVSFKVKLIDIKWAATFNLSLKHLRSSVGLTFLHTTMCSAGSEVSRWIMHRYPELIHVEDSQRDTPLTIALKEGSYMLVQYSLLNGGNLDDGTSYSDDIFFDYYPEVVSAREALTRFGEFFPEFADIYVLQEAEILHLKKHGYFVDRPPDENVVIKKKKPVKKKLVIEKVKPVVSRRKKGKVSASANLDIDLFVKRFPEDNVYDNYESGEMTCWKVLNISVPLATVQVNEFDEKAERKEDEEDLKRVIKTLQRIKRPQEDEVIQKDDYLYEELGNFDDGFLSGDYGKKRTILEQITDAKALSSLMKSGGNALFSFVAGVHSKLGARDVRYKICKYAEIFLSDEIRAAIKNYNWNVDAYLEFNRLSSKLQGEVAQQLAFACNFGPPEGFARMSNWTRVIVPTEYDEFEGLHGDEILKPLVDTFKFAKKVGGAVGKPLLAISKTLNRTLGTAANNSSNNEFNDRVVHYLAECVVSSRTRLDLCDCELSGPARIAFRAIIRSLRRTNCSFIIPSIFCPPRRIIITHMELRSNELDCGDAILIADALIVQQTVKLLDLSQNRIGSRGMIRLCKVLKAHESIKVFKVNDNRIGPAAGKDIGLLLKDCKTLLVLEMARNRMGDLVRYPLPQKREKIDAAARDILWGLKTNEHLESLDISYNHMGPKLAELLPPAIQKHPTLAFLNISGNDLGRQGAIMIWSMACSTVKLSDIFRTIKSDNEAAIRMEQERKDKGLAAIEEEKNIDDDDESQVGASVAGGGGGKSSNTLAGSATSGSKQGSVTAKYPKLCALGLADNQLGTAAGKALGLLLKGNKKLTSLDVSGNSLGFEGGLAMAEALEKVYGVEARAAKQKIFEELTKQVTKRQRTKKVVYSILLHLNIRRNGCGPAVVSSLMQCLEKPNCSITNLDVSENFFNHTVNNSGDSNVAGLDIRSGIGKSFSIVRLNLGSCGFIPTQMVPILGGLGKNSYIMRINLSNTILDEPSCLQLSNALATSKYVESIEIANARMGPKGGGLVLGMIEQIRQRLTNIDVSGNSIGSYAIIPLAKALAHPDCAIRTLNVSRNNLEEEGGIFIAKALFKNNTVTDIDISSNSLTAEVGECLADSLRGFFVRGRKVSDTAIKRIVISDNPDIGPNTAKALMYAVANDVTEHVEFRKIGGGPGLAKEVALFLRRVTVPWTHLDISDNDSYRTNFNLIFWSLRHNNRVRVFKAAGNKAGTVFGTDDDEVGIHGISICRALSENTIITHLDLSNNNLTSGAAANIFDALKYNQTIRSVNLSGNLFDDACNTQLGDLLAENDTLIELILHHNKLGYACGVSISEAMLKNRSLKILDLAQNKISNAGTVSMHFFYKFLCMNCFLRTLILDGNRLGMEWGMMIAEGMCRNSTITQLSMNNTFIPVEVGKALVNMYVNNKTLLELGLTLDEIGTGCFEKLREVFVSKRALKTVDDMMNETRITPLHTHHKLKVYDHHKR